MLEVGVCVAWDMMGALKEGEESDEEEEDGEEQEDECWLLWGVATPYTYWEAVLEEPADDPVQHEVDVVAEEEEEEEEEKQEEEEEEELVEGEQHE